MTNEMGSVPVNVETGTQMRASAIVWLVILVAILVIICFDGLSRMGINTIIFLLVCGCLSLAVECLIEKYVFSSEKAKTAAVPAGLDLPPWRKYQFGDPRFEYPEKEEELISYIAETHPFMGREERLEMVDEIKAKREKKPKQ
ncbi:MAG: hypothetical protein PHP03_02325 [Candidatus Pacebacteria bacterium]|nr:hypothetical protein [Candidatus Paceibacterota bacterium]